MLNLYQLVERIILRCFLKNQTIADEKYGETGRMKVMILTNGSNYYPATTQKNQPFFYIIYTNLTGCWEDKMIEYRTARFIITKTLSFLLR